MSVVCDNPYDPPQEPDGLAQALAWAIVGAFAIWAGWGWLADGANWLTVLQAVAFGLFQIATNVLAVKVRELWGRGAFITALAAFAAMLCTGLLTHESLNHAYAEALERGYVSADPALMSALLLGVPFLEPLLFWINRILIEPPQPRRVTVGLVPMVMLALFGPKAIAAPVPPPMEPPQPTPMARRMPAHNLRQLDDPARAQARLMIRQGMTPYSVHKATNVPLGTLKDWRKRMYAEQAPVTEAA